MDKQRKSFYLLLLIVFIVLAVLIISVKVCANSILKSMNDLKDRYASIENYQNKEKYLASLDEEIKEIGIKQSIMQNVFIKKDKEVDFIMALEQLAKETNNNLEISVGSLPIDQKKNNKVTKPSSSAKDILSFNLKVAGTFPDLLKFIDKIESNSYLVEVASVDIRKINESKTFLYQESIAANIEGNIATDMVIYAYFK